MVVFRRKEACTMWSDASKDNKTIVNIIVPIDGEGQVRDSVKNEIVVFDFL